MRQTLLLVLILFFYQNAFASVPRTCDGDEESIHKMLHLLAKSAKEYYEKNGKLPGVWSHEMADIISDVPSSEKFGNINPSYDGHKIEITCSDKRKDGKYNHIHHYIDMKTLSISLGSDNEI
ncbi:hypothetical protein ACUR5C_01620 [Aliikangiella sp. IMCC44653]